MTPRIKKYNEPSKTIGVRVPISKLEYYKKELNDYAMHLFIGGKPYRELINPKKENLNKTKKEE